MESYISVLTESQERQEALSEQVRSTETELKKEHFELLFDDQRKKYEADIKLVKLTTLWFNRLVYVFVFSVLAVAFLGYIHAKHFKEIP